MLFWWSIVHGTRTQHFLTGDRFGIIREVEIEYDPVIKDVDRVDKGINDLPLVFRAAHVTLAEFFKPEPNPLTGQDGLFQLFFQNAGVQGFFPGFQLVQPLLGGRGQDALFNGFQKVCEPFLRIPELLFQNRQPGVLLLLGFHDQIYQPFDDFIAEDHLNGGVHHEPLQRLLADGFQVAVRLAVALGVAALVVIVGVSHVAGAAFATHQGAALATEQLSGQQIAHILFCRPTVGDPVLLETLLNPVEQILVNNSRNAARRHNVLVAVFADVAAVAEDLEEAVLYERLPGAGTQAALIQGCCNLLSRFAVGVPGEDLLHDGSRFRVDMVQPVLLADGEAQRHHTAVVLALEGVFALTARHFQGEFGGIVFRHANQHTLHHNAFRPLRDGFHGRHQMDTVLFQLVLVVHGIEPIPGKAVQLPDQNYVEDFLSAVLDHPLKVWAVIRFGRVGTVNVGADHGDAVLLGVVFAVAQLSFNGRFALAVGRIAGVDHSSHGCISLVARSGCLYSIESSAACQQSASRLKFENYETQRKREEQESSRGHKFSILENIVPFRDCTSATLPHF